MKLIAFLSLYVAMNSTLLADFASGASDEITYDKDGNIIPLELTGVRNNLAYLLNSSDVVVSVLLERRLKAEPTSLAVDVQDVVWQREGAQIEPKLVIINDSIQYKDESRQLRAADVTDAPSEREMLIYENVPSLMFLKSVTDLGPYAKSDTLKGAAVYKCVMAGSGCLTMTHQAKAAEEGTFDVYAKMTQPYVVKKGKSMFGTTDREMIYHSIKVFYTLGAEKFLALDNAVVKKYVLDSAKLTMLMAKQPLSVVTADK